MMSSPSTIPSTMRAFVHEPGNTGAVQEVPVPSIDDDDVLVRVVAVAQNPTDWKAVAMRNNPGAITGCDFSGHIAKVGKNVTKLAVGDHVAGFVPGSMWKDRGAFAEYLKTPGTLVWKVPDGTLSHEEAATLGCAFWTAVQALYHPTRLGLAEPPEKATNEEWVFVYGGSSSVGMFAIQLAHIAGYKVATVASPRNFDLCKSLGADAVFDYKDPGAVQKIKSTTGDSLHYALDTISTGDTQKFTVNTLAPGTGKVIVLLPRDDEAQQLRRDVDIQVTLIYTANGLEFGPFRGVMYPVSHADRLHMEQFLEKVPELVKSEQIKPNPTKLFDGGLEGIDSGLKYMAEGKNSGEKIVYRVV